MARFKRYRKYTRRSRGRWSANIQELGTTDIVIPIGQQGAFSNSFTLAFNPTQLNTSVSQVFTVKNFEVTFELSGPTGGASTSAIEDVTAYIMFVPQGMQVNNGYNLEHPEYIMAYKFLGSPTNDTPNSMAQPTKVISRMARKLQSGDSVILFIKGNNTSNNTGAITVEFHGLARWWTKAN